MNKIIISFFQDSINFKIQSHPTKNQDNLMNTNIISNEQLVFSDEYIDDNRKVVLDFLKEIIEKKNISSLKIYNETLIFAVIDLLKNVKQIKTLYIVPNINLSYSLAEKVIAYGNIKLINCFSAPSYMLEMMDRHNIIIDCRSEMLIVSAFMMNNGLTSYSKIYYKMNIRFNEALSKEDIDDFKTFCIINNYLKTIHLEKYTYKDLLKIIEILEENRIKRITIMIHSNITSKEEIINLKKLNKKCQKHKIKLQLVYDEKYLQSNLLGQLITNTLRLCGLMICVLVVAMLAYIGINDYKSEYTVEKINSEINSVLSEIPEENVSQEESDNNTVSEEIIEERPKQTTYQKLMALQSINSDTVGWLTIKNTNINYPIVQAKDNKYYLKHNYSLDYDNYGWVYMDYRNNAENLDKNTIIYGHNIYTSGVAFGTLYNISKKSWYEDESNRTITFNTFGEDMEWEIFSFYVIDYTTDYIKTSFTSDTEYQNFLNMITARSDVDLGINPTSNDKVITMSTCKNGNQRFVVHAVLKTKNN